MIFCPANYAQYLVPGGGTVVSDRWRIKRMIFSHRSGTQSQVLPDFYGTKRPKSLRCVLGYPYGIGIKRGPGKNKKPLLTGSEFQSVK
jgi:hypothetical protein